MNEVRKRTWQEFHEQVSKDGQIRHQVAVPSHCVAALQAHKIHNCWNTRLSCCPHHFLPSRHSLLHLQKFLSVLNNERVR